MIALKTLCALATGRELNRVSVVFADPFVAIEAILDEVDMRVDFVFTTYSFAFMGEAVCFEEVGVGCVGFRILGKFVVCL